MAREWRDPAKYLKPSSMVRPNLYRVNKAGEVIDKKGIAVSLHDNGHYLLECKDRSEAWYSPRVLARVVWGERPPVGKRYARESWLAHERPVTGSQLATVKPKPIRKKSESVPAKRKSISDTPVLPGEHLYHRPERTKSFWSRSVGRESSESRSDRQQRRSGVAGVIDAYVESASRRGYVWELSDNHAAQLMSSVCHYCGCQPGAHNQNGLNGIDRVNNGSGYLPDNVVACCAICNKLKGTLSPNFFLAHIRRIAEHSK